MTSPCVPGGVQGLGLGIKIVILYKGFPNPKSPNPTPCKASIPRPDPYIPILNLNLYNPKLIVNLNPETQSLNPIIPKPESLQPQSQIRIPSSLRPALLQQLSGCKSVSCNAVPRVSGFSVEDLGLRVKDLGFRVDLNPQSR